MRLLLIALALALTACGQLGGGHSHEASGGHAHGEEGGHSHESGATASYTVWTDQTELFVEFPALVAGKTSRFAAHLTRLQGHEPVTEGKVTASLIRGRSGIRNTAEGPASPGIFTPALQPKEPGEYTLVFDLQASGFTDRITINEVRVYPTEEAAAEATSHEAEEGGISFSKEQAWKMDFRTAMVVQKPIYEVINTSGTWNTAPSDMHTLVATSTGRVNFSYENLTEGTAVKAGQPLMTLSTEGLTANNLSAEIQKARASLEQAKAEYERKKKLNESKIIPGAELEQAQQKYEVARATYQSLTAGVSGGKKSIFSPFDGYITSITAGNGDFVEEGARLLTVSRQSNSVLEAKVSASAGLSMADIQNIWYQPRQGVWSSLKESSGEVLSVDRKVSSGQANLSVFARVSEAVQMPQGSFTEVQLAIGEASASTVIPSSALLEDYGQYSVIVQTGGETFKRRYVKIGKQNGHETEITEGLNPGEVVVTEGAFQVKMASMAGQAPAHGHAH
ncbi:efflux RND transporter periplasmic adaptor subunit [Roseivirga sp. BDSF3-8]|uniref:efflux RND transporter periplasmic adaptor subunit n=1 Tax=Roseivirga sp. BDSF3-8 TaxID=3241598 RepID=UPI0035324AD0